MKKRAETLRKSRKKSRNNRERFIKETFSFSKKILNLKIKGKLKSTKEGIEDYLKTTDSDDKKETSS